MRTPFKPISQPELIRPVAQPVNTYVRPADPAPSSLHQLAEGLGDLAGGLSSLVQQRDAKQQEADAAKAEALFNENNQVPFAEAVRQGLIPAHASQTFVSTYKAAQGNLAGIQLQQKFVSEYSQWEGRNSNDPAAFQTWMRDFVANNVDPNTDPGVLKGLNPHVRRLWENGYNTFSSDSDRAIKEGSKATMGAIINRLVDAADDQSTADARDGAPQETNYKALWDDVQRIREENVKSGMRYEDADEAIVNSVVTKAIETGDTKLLDMLKQRIPGKEVNYEDIPEFALKKAQALQSINTDRRQMLSEQERLSKQANEKEKDALTADVLRRIAEDPNAEIPEKALQRIEALGDARIRASIRDWKKGFSDDAQQEDRQLILRLQEGIMNGSLRQADLQAAIRDGRIKSPETYMSLATRLETVLKEGAKGDGILTGRTATQMRNLIAERILNVPGANIIRDINGTPQMLSDEALEAQSEFDMGLLQWDRDHPPGSPNSSIMDREKFIRDWGADVMGRVSTERLTPDSQSGTFNSAQDTARQQLQQNEMAKGRQDQGVNQTSDTEIDDSTVNRMFREDAPPQLDKVPEAYRKMIEDGATRLNRTPEDLNEEIWKRYLEKSGKKVPDAYLKKSSLEDNLGSVMNASLDMTQGGQLDDTSKARLAGAAQLLSSFTGPEGTSVDGYNTTLANGKLTGGKVNLTGMTLDQIDALQTEMLAHPDNKWNSSALGQYQIVQKTLRTLKDEMGLTGQEVFDEKLQDRMGLALLDRRGYSKWLAGDITDEKFISELRNEWDGLNKVSKSSLVSSLQAVKEGGVSAFDTILAEGDQEDAPGGGLADLVSPAKYEGTGKLRFAHADQEAGVEPELRTALERVSEELGQPLKITSGFRSSRHPVERRKGNGGGEHTRGNAVDIDMAGMNEAQRSDLIRRLQAQGLKRFILYSNSPNMIHVDLKDQRGDGTSYFMFNKSARNMGSAPSWYRALVRELEAQRSV